MVVFQNFENNDWMRELKKIPIPDSISFIKLPYVSHIKEQIFIKFIDRGLNNFPIEDKAFCSKIRKLLESHFQGSVNFKLLSQIESSSLCSKLFTEKCICLISMERQAFIYVPYGFIKNGDQLGYFSAVDKAKVFMNFNGHVDLHESAEVIARNDMILNKDLFYEVGRVDNRRYYHIPNPEIRKVQVCIDFDFWQHYHERIIDPELAEAIVENYDGFIKSYTPIEYKYKDCQVKFYSVGFYAFYDYADIEYAISRLVFAFKMGQKQYLDFFVNMFMHLDSVLSESDNYFVIPIPPSSISNFACRYSDFFRLLETKSSGKFRFQSDMMDCSLLCDVVGNKHSGETGQSFENIKFSNINGKDIIIFDDVITSGKSMKKMVEMINEHHPRSLTCVSLFKTYKFATEFRAKIYSYKYQDIHETLVIPSTKCDDDFEWVTVTYNGYIGLLSRNVFFLKFLNYFGMYPKITVKEDSWDGYYSWTTEDDKFEGEFKDAIKIECSRFIGSWLKKFGCA